MNFLNPYSRIDYKDFFQNKLLTDEFEFVEEELSLEFKPQYLKRVELLGRDKSLELDVYEILHDSENDPRVGLSKDIFRLMSKYGAKRALAILYSPHSNNYRLSLATVELSLEGSKIKREYSNPRRYSFFLGSDSKIHTPSEFLISKGRVSDFEDLQNRFSIEVVNKEFYQRIAIQFSKLVGGKRKVGSHTEEYRRTLSMPAVKEQHIFQEFTVRLIGRLVFCWFLKMKRSDNNIPLISPEVLSLGSAKAQSNYYHNVLEKLFFEILNTPIAERRKEYTVGPYYNIPFLNGGLFSPHNDDYYETDRSGVSKYVNTLKVPDKWLQDFIEILETFNFTVDENTSVDVDLSVDPEMLGRIFENLLAEINPQTGDSARKSTGSYYTPRPIVEYMVDETLKQYLLTVTKIEKEKIDNLLSYSDCGVNLTSNEKQKIVDAFDKVKILDPACGSGAFPIGVLNKMLLVLKRVDPESMLWLDKQLARIDVQALRNDLKQKLVGENVEYVHKLGIIQNSIYGIDIQPIATEISKLRCFLSLIIDEKIVDEKNNRGILPLPNLEFKFVSSNTLIDLGLDAYIRKWESEFGFNNDAIKKIQQLQFVRDKFFNPDFNSRDKKTIINLFNDIRNEIKSSINDIKSDRRLHNIANLLMNWDPFDPSNSTGFFSPGLMFGIYDGFDIVIGNPPYGLKFTPDFKKYAIANYHCARSIKNLQNGSTDSFALFIERSLFQLSQKETILSFIIPMAFTSSESMYPIHKLILENCEQVKISTYFERPKKIFSNAEISVSILFAIKNFNKCKSLMTTKVNKRYSETPIENIITNLNFVNALPFVQKGRIPKIGTEIEISILQKIYSLPHRLSHFVDYANTKIDKNNSVFYRFAGGRYYKIVTNYSTNSSAEAYFNVKEYDRDLMCALLSSNLGYWFYHIHCNYPNWKFFELEIFPVPIFNDVTSKKIIIVYKKYLQDLQSHSKIKYVNYSNISEYREFYARQSKHIIDQIDLLIKDGYGLTSEEIDFIINYDIKFRTDDD